jgi:chromosome segregation ATPase
MKSALCDTAERLAEEEDVISAFHQLQELHSQYREIGPVAKELRDEIWNRFKQASTVVNRRHAAHFEAIRSQEEVNLSKKEELCEKIEAIANATPKSSSEWEEKTKEVIALQAEWKTIGFAPQKMNVKIFERFRAACDDFFGRKAEYFKGLKDTFKENAEKKRALIEKAKALQDSTEWKSTGDKLIALQKEWKTIGMVPKKLGDQLWEEFLGACNKFFEARKAAGAGQQSDEYANLAKKREVIEKIKAAAEEAGDNIQEKVQKLVEEYNAIGHVPFKEKDKIYEEYHAVLDKLYKELNISVAKRRLNNFKQNLKQVAERGENALDNERARLFRQYEAIKQEVQTYENNLGFLNASSKKGNSLIDEMNRKVQKLKDDMNLVREKIKAIDAENKE